MSDDLGVGLGDEFVALRRQFALQVEIVFDDAVVDHDNAARAVAMGMRVLFRGSAMRGPAGMADAEGSLQRMFVENIFQIGQLAGGAAHLEDGRIRAAHCDACRVVAAVFEAPQPLNNDRDNLLRTDIPNNSAHNWILCDRRESLVTGR